MSEQAREATEPPKDVKAVWERTRGLNKRLTALEELKLDEAVAELSIVLERLAEEPKAKKAGVWNWSAMTPSQRAAAWRHLLEWTEKVFRPRYPRSYHDMLGYEAYDSCWYKHPDLVELLSGLLGSWHWAYTDPESTPLRVAEWLDRWLPGAVRQGQFILAACKNGSHRDQMEDKPLMPNGELLKHIAELEEMEAER